MKRVLIVEDKEALFQEYMRFFQKVMGDEVEEFEFSHVSNLPEALQHLEYSNWDAILLDYELGSSTSVEVGDGEQVKVHHGADLARFRRSVEKESEEMSKAHIVGIASHRVGNDLLRKAGADTTIHKLQIQLMARELLNLLQRERAQRKEASTS